jgi:hypothetical protein
MGFDHYRDVLSGVDSQIPPPAGFAYGQRQCSLSSLWAWWRERIRSEPSDPFSSKSCISCLPLTFRFDPDEIEVDVSSARSSGAAEFLSTLKLLGSCGCCFTLGILAVSKNTLPSMQHRQGLVFFRYHSRRPLKFQAFQCVDSGGVISDFFPSRCNLY